MIIEYKYPIDTLVNYLHMENVPYMTTCKTCLGDGFITRKDGKELKCPVCKGEHIYSDDGSSVEVIKSGIVNHIFINITDIESSIFYNLKDNDISFTENQLSLSTEDIK